MQIVLKICTKKCDIHCKDFIPIIDSGDRWDIDIDVLILILSQGLYLGLDYRIIGKSMFLCGLQSKLQVHVV